jgi:uncharacterized repeat protein (TIGR03803 family)
MAAVLLVTITVVLVLVPRAGAQSRYKSLFNFKFMDGADGIEPRAALILDAAGNLYGTTTLAGGHGNGTVFKLTPNADGTWTTKVLYSFAFDGDIPEAALIFDGAGDLYGTTVDGGANREGVAFRLTPNMDGTWTETVLYSFCALTSCRDGSVPTSSLVFDTAGNLYGTTALGGAGEAGTVFQLIHNADGSWKEKVLHRFMVDDGATPQSGVIFDSTGNLYGTTLQGGNASNGTVFKLAPNADGRWTEHVLYSFCRLTACEDGAMPHAGLIFDASGNLYGTTTEGGAYGKGVVFQLAPNADGRWKEKVIYSFTGGTDGGVPAAGLTFDQTGNLYGTTFFGGNLNYCKGLGCGVAFRLVPNSKGRWHEKVVHGFIDDPGAAPDAGVVFDAAGNLYGTSAGDGITTFGSVFEITP